MHAQTKNKHSCAKTSKTKTQQSYAKNKKLGQLCKDKKNGTSVPIRQTATVHRPKISTAVHRREISTAVLIDDNLCWMSKISTAGRTISTSVLAMLAAFCISAAFIWPKVPNLMQARLVLGSSADPSTQILYLTFYSLDLTFIDPAEG